MECDVLIVGGGPAGSTVGSLLKKYAPPLNVVILERETFPRDHVGESQLPAVCQVLNEMGAWDKVEAAGFPVKIGSTYRWGATDELWNLNFLPTDYSETKRPGTYQGQRAQTAFQVERKVYDQILLDHAAELGCQVLMPAKALRVRTGDDRIEAVEVQTGEQVETVRARYYVDASGTSGLFRRSLGIGVDSPTALRNIAFWDYWQDAEWAETVGCEGTRVQVMSIGWGWIWFIPVSATRTSIGLVLPTAYFKESGETPEGLYHKAIQTEPRIAALIGRATCERRFETTTDWNFVSDRLAGPNWFLAGDACGFADPILAAGMTLAQVSSRKVAYSILEADRNQVPYSWLADEYNRRHRQTIRYHMRFAEFWYSANGCFTDLENYCSEIAESAGIRLDPKSAFQWLAAGGFANETLTSEQSTAFGFASFRQLVGRFVRSESAWEVHRNNKLELALTGVEEAPFPVYADGRVIAARAYRRGTKVLPLIGLRAVLVTALGRESDVTRLSKLLWHYFTSHPQEYPAPEGALRASVELLEAMIADGWITASVDPSMPPPKDSRS